MKSKYALIPLTCLVAVYFALQDNASADDCHDLLIHDTHSTKKDITTRLSFYSEITKDNFEQRKKNVDTAGDYLGIISGSADYGDFNDKRDHLFAKYGFSYDHQDLSSYYESTLPIERVREYARCQHRFGFLAHVEHVSEDILDIQVEWDKGMNMPETVKFRPSFLDGGEIKGDAPKQLNHGEQFTIAFKRNEGKDFHLNVNVGGTTARVFVPRFIKEPPPPPPGEVWRVDDIQKPFVLSDPSLKVRIWYDEGDGERVGVDNSNNIDPKFGNFIFISKGSSSIFTIESGPNLGIFLTGKGTYAKGRYEVIK